MNSTDNTGVSIIQKRIAHHPKSQFQNDHFSKSDAVDPLSLNTEEKSDDTREYVPTTPINVALKIEEAQINICKNEDERQEIEMIILKPTETSLFCVQCQRAYDDVCPVHSTRDPLQMNTFQTKVFDTPDSRQWISCSESISENLNTSFITSKKRTFRCRTCNGMFISRHNLWKHQLSHAIPSNNRGKLYKCNYCNHLDRKKCADFAQHMLHKYGN